MSIFRPPEGLTRRVVCGLLLSTLLLGCSSSSSGSASTTATTYTVKGRLESIQPTANGYGFLNIKHEAVTDFRDEKGAVVGMEVMTMPFAYGPGIDPATLTVGGAVKMVFVMDYAAEPKLFIRSIEGLAKGTSLAL